MKRFYVYDSDGDEVTNPDYCVKCGFVGDMGDDCPACGDDPLDRWKMVKCISCGQAIPYFCFDAVPQIICPDCVKGHANYVTW